MALTPARWELRLQNLLKAVVLLAEPVARGVESLSALEREGMLQRYQIALELSWKTLRDFLEAEGQSTETATPKGVIRQAFAVGLPVDATLWFEMVDLRNLWAHTCDAAVVEQAVGLVRDQYLPAIDALSRWLDARRVG